MSLVVADVGEDCVGLGCEPGVGGDVVSGQGDGDVLQGFTKPWVPRYSGPTEPDTSGKRQRGYADHNGPIGVEIDSTNTSFRYW